VDARWRGIRGAGNVRELQNLIEAGRKDSVTGSWQLIRKSSTDEMGVRELSHNGTVCSVEKLIAKEIGRESSYSMRT
jgi:hypothetical protein